MVNLSVLKELSLAKNPDFRIHISLETKTLDISNYKYDNLSLKVSMVYIIWFRRYKYEAIWNGVKFYKIQVKAWLFLKIWRKDKEFWISKINQIKWFFVLAATTSKGKDRFYFFENRSFYFVTSYKIRVGNLAKIWT